MTAIIKNSGDRIFKKSLVLEPTFWLLRFVHEKKQNVPVLQAVLSSKNRCQNQQFVTTFAHPFQNPV